MAIALIQRVAFLRLDHGGPWDGPADSRRDGGDGLDTDALSE